MGPINIISENEALLADREQAAEMLGSELCDYKDHENLIVLGIPRGGVIIADKLATNLNAALDIVLTRKIRAPHNPELAIGAVSEDGKLYTKQSTVNTLNVTQEYINREKDHRLNEIRERKQRYRQVLQKESLNGKIVILTDDGVATGATMQAAIWASLAEFPEKLILALPVAPPDTLKQLAEDADETICLSAPSNFMSISQFYTCFEQVEDEQVVEVLKRYSRADIHG
jgi:predicted phosphoribosyltransferase